MSAPSPSVSVDVAALAVRALTLYALAEFQSGHASTIRVNAEGASFGVGDDGRGHAISRTVEGAPYLQFIYTHLDYPFSGGEGGTVQLHGIGMSVITSLCTELSVTAQKPEEVLRMTYRTGRLVHEEHTKLRAQSTGNTVVGVVNQSLQAAATNTDEIEQWLNRVAAANPALKLYFNGKELHAPQSAA